MKKSDISATSVDAVAMQAPLLPPHVANNALEFLKRVKMDGLEAFAFCEAYSTLQRFAAPPGASGVPFQGLT